MITFNKYDKIAHFGTGKPAKLVGLLHVCIFERGFDENTFVGYNLGPNCHYGILFTEKHLWTKMNDFVLFRCALDDRKYMKFILVTVLLKLVHYKIHL